MNYDAFDRQSRWVFPSKTTPGVADPSDYEEYRYDSGGNRISARKRDGSVLTFQYDALDRMTAKIVPERSGLTPAQTRDVHYDYDLRGLQTKAQFDALGGEGITNAYDGFGRLVSSTLAMGGASGSTVSEYDRNGNLTRLIYPLANFSHGRFSLSYRYVYDEADRLVASTYPSGGALAGWKYDPQGRLKILTGYGVPLTTLGYDPVSRLESMGHDLPGSAGDVSFALAYNPASQAVTRSVSNDSYASSAAYAVSRDYAVNGLNQYTSAGPASFAYDPNGNLVSDGSTSFVYDVENRLVSASGAKTASLVYDPLGRLWQTSGGSGGTIRFVYEGDKLLMEVDPAGALLRGYVHGVAPDTPVIWFEGAQVGGMLVTDHQGSIVATVKPGGANLAINAYDEYGIPNAGNVGRFGYTGQAWIPELGMYYYKARFYSPTLGRFLQVDPIGYDDQINLYAYVGNDPVNFVDPEGTSKRCRSSSARGRIGAIVHLVVAVCQLVMGERPTRPPVEPTTQRPITTPQRGGKGPGPKPGPKGPEPGPKPPGSPAPPGGSPPPLVPKDVTFPRPPDIARPPTAPALPPPPKLNLPQPTPPPPLPRPPKKLDF